jgi:hypothetical protein
MRLKIQIPRHWARSNDGTPTFICLTSETSGALQISFGEYTSGEIPNPTPEDLQEMSTGFGKKNNLGHLIESSCGPCLFGTMGTAVFRSTEHARFQIWFLSNGRDFIMATHISIDEPDPAEVADAQEIVRQLTLGPDEPVPAKKSKWKFW